METPSLNTGNVASVTGAAMNPNNYTAVQTVTTINEYETTADLEITVANASGSDVANIQILVGAGATPATLATGISITSPFASLADLRDYFKNMPCLIQGMRFDTSDPDNYAGKLVVGERLPNAQTKSTDIPFDRYRQGTGGGLYANTAEVNDSKRTHTTHPAWFMTLSLLKAGSSMIIKLTIPKNGRSQEMADVKY